MDRGSRGRSEPTSSPLAEGLADLEQIVARARELVTVTAPLSLGCRLDNAEAFELLEPLREERVGESGRTLEDLAEGFTAQMQVADDQRRPALSEDLRATGDRAVLPVSPHEHSVPRLVDRREVQIPYFEVQIAAFSSVPRRCCDEPIDQRRNDDRTNHNADPRVPGRRDRSRSRWIRRGPRRMERHASIGALD